MGEEGMGAQAAAGAASGVAGIVGGIVGYFASGSERDKATQAMQNAQNIINSLQLPPDQTKPVIIQQLKSAGVWKPELEQHIDAGISKVSQIQEDPALRAKQTATLNALQQIADTGMTATGRAEFNTDRAKAQQDVEAKRQQILQGMQQRGMAGAGSELAMQLQAAQGGANEEAASADRIASQQEQAKMAALGQLGGMAGQVRGQDFSTAAAKAGAADAFKMFDVSNEISQQARNVGAKNQAAQYDTMNNQAINNANTTAANQELYRQKAGEQLNFQDQMALANDKANAALGQAKQSQAQAQQVAQGWGNIGTGVAGGLQAYPAISKAVGKGGSSDSSASSPGEESVDLNSAQFSSGPSKGAVNGPALPSGNLTTSEDPYWQQSLMASR